MALNNDDLRDLIVAQLQAAGFVTVGPHAWAVPIATAVANAVVAHILASAEVNVASGSSAGLYKVA